MKLLCLFSAAAVLTSGCNKSEDKDPVVSKPPKPEARLKPSSSPPPGTVKAPGPDAVDFSPVDTNPPAPATAQELEVFYGEVDGFAKKVAPFLNGQAPAGSEKERDELMTASSVLYAKRADMLKRIPFEQRKDFSKRVMVLMQASVALKNSGRTREGSAPQSVEEALGIPVKPPPGVTPPPAPTPAAPESIPAPQ